MRAEPTQRAEQETNLGRPLRPLSIGCFGAARGRLRRQMGELSSTRLKALKRPKNAFYEVLDYADTFLHS